MAHFKPARQQRGLLRFALGAALALACGPDDPSPELDAATRDAANDASASDSGSVDAGFDAAFDAAPPCPPSDRVALRVVTFNTGTTSGMGAATHPDGYDEEKERFSDEYYGNGLAWTAAVEATRRWLLANAPDIVAFQEIFYSGECATVPPEARAGFVCEDWVEGAPTVANLVLGSDYQVACHQGKPDKCLAVRRAIGTLRGCETDLCLDGLDGARIDGCGGGSRVGRGVVDLAGGGTVTVATVHGSSGLSADDQSCRSRQFEQLFEDLLDGSGEGAANGSRNLVLGDFNTDPWRALRFDESARRLETLVTDHGFHFISEVGPDAPGSYGGVADIDHVLSDTFVGRCWYAGLTEGRAAVYDAPYFDHRPVVCEVEACRP